MKTRFAFIGFQHPHVWDLVTRAKAHPQIEVVACCEEDAATRAALADGAKVTITHDDHRAMLAAVPCDVVVVGDWFAKRGRIVIDALAAGKHVLADKPICTTLAELDEIERMAAEKKLTIGLMLDMRDSGVFRTARELVRSGAIGEIRAAALGGQHPLLPGVRAAWYHEAGKQAGTINDIAVHGIDIITWITGLEFARINAARVWAAGVPADSHFANAGQAMLELTNGAGLLLDVSYFAPNSFGYTFPLYWRLTLWGSGGVLETSMTSKEITLYAEGEKVPRTVPVGAGNPGGYLTAFLDELHGQGGTGVTMAEALRASRVTLTAQDAADRRQCNIDL
jgi:predicted dehydrogenase